MGDQEGDGCKPKFSGFFDGLKQRMERARFVLERHVRPEALPSWLEKINGKLDALNDCLIEIEKFDEMEEKKTKSARRSRDGVAEDDVDGPGEGVILIDRSNYGNEAEEIVTADEESPVKKVVRPTKKRRNRRPFEEQTGNGKGNKGFFFSGICAIDFLYHGNIHSHIHYRGKS
jgi:hypothetical protein